MDVEVLYGGDEVPESPFRVDVAPELNVSKVKVLGLPEGNYVEEYLILEMSTACYIVQL